MDSAYVEHFRNRVLQEFPQLVQAIGEGAARQELEYSFLDRNHMLYPEEIDETRNEVLHLGGVALNAENPNG